VPFARFPSLADYPRLSEPANTIRRRFFQAQKLRAGRVAQDMLDGKKYGAYQAERMATRHFAQTVAWVERVLAHNDPAWWEARVRLDPETADWGAEYVCDCGVATHRPNGCCFCEYSDAGDVLAEAA
jgi:hypothetical protein